MGHDIARAHSLADPTTIRGMSENPSSSASSPLVPVHEAAALLGGSPALYIALIEGGLIEGQLIDGTWHVDTGVVGAALAVRTAPRLEGEVTRATCTAAAQGHPVRTADGAA